MEEVKVNCFVLDAVQEDLHPVWEVVSVLSQRLKNVSAEHAIESLVVSLNFLLSNKYIEMYKGHKFRGEQELIGQFQIDKKFILDHKDDWKNRKQGEMDFRIAITEEGLKFMNTNCKPEYFSGS